MMRKQNKMIVEQEKMAHNQEKCKKKGNDEIIKDLEEAINEEKSEKMIE